MAKKKQKEMEPMGDEAILRYDMTDMEAQAFRVLMFWMDRSRKVFPDCRHSTLGKGDPRKSLIFKICYKLVRETQGVLDQSEYPLYVRAQLDVLKHIVKNSGNPLIDPSCLVGEKAWRRWRLWKRRYDSISARSDDGVEALAAGALKALDGLEKTKEFLVRSMGQLELEKYEQAAVNKNLYRWINQGKVSPYYVAMSPYVRKAADMKELGKLNFQPDLYIGCATEAVVEAFKRMFPHEGEPLRRDDWVSIEDVVEEGGPDV